MMRYEVRLGGEVRGRFAQEAEATALARRLVQKDADRVPEIIDTTTGRPAEPAASEAERERLANEVGF